VLAADLLQSVVNKAMQARLLRLPINVGYTSDFPIIQYVDDTLLIMEACPQQLCVLKALLNTFADSTRLKVNYVKSSMVPINLGEKRLHHLASTFQCQAGSFPQPSIQDCMPLVHRMEKRLISTSLFLTQDGKKLVNSALSSLPTFYMCAIKVPIDILNQVDKYRRHCLWKGGDMNTRKQSLAAWKIVTCPMSKGGLGVIKLRLQNEALLMKKLDNFFNKVDLPWVHLIWEKYYQNGKLPGA
jgi:hypothetical protein